MLRKIAVMAVFIMIFAISSMAQETTKGGKMNHTHVIFTTSIGNFEIELFDDQALITVKNFLKYVDSGYYNGTVFHRVIPGFMTQGGGYTEDYKEKEGGFPPINNEADNGLKNERGTLSMARTNNPHSATSQFFINFVDNDFLNFTGKNPQGWGYAVFGKVVSGMDVVDAMAKVPTGSKAPYMRDVPKTPIVVVKAERKK
jgi:peptidyl-prolyl cis-trans isomerase B (cyclophilin B)